MRNETKVPTGKSVVVKVSKSAQFRADVAELATRYAQGDVAKFARIALTNVLTDKERQECLFSRSGSEESGEFLIHFAGYDLRVYQEHGLWKSDAWSTVWYDVDGTALAPRESTMDGNGNVRYQDQTRYVLMRVVQDVMTGLTKRAMRKDEKPTREIVAQRDDTIKRQAEMIAERDARDAERDAEIAELRAMLAKVSAS